MKPALIAALGVCAGVWIAPRAAAPAAAERHLRNIRQLTFGEGTNESPTFAPNGRHLAFMSTRAGKSQVFTIGKDGKGLKQITKAGNNEKPDWSR